MPDKAVWHSASIGVVERELETSVADGLDSRDAAQRLAAYGLNLLRMARGPSVIGILVSQFQDFMVLVLLGATAVSAYLGEYQDVFAILAIVILNAALGFVQEFRAERALAALRRLAAPHATVLRDGALLVIDAANVVPGDILILNSGDRAPADARLVECHGVEVDESVLTGESRPVRKDSSAIMRESAPAPERLNMVHAGTVLTRGRGVAITTATGMDTEMGRIAGMMSEASEGDTPLQRRLAQLGKWLVAGCLAICGAVAAIGVARGEPAHAMFLAGVSLAVAAIPEGLPAIVTVSLALGVQRMSRRRAIVRKLSAVEALGCATVICADKTGTLTQNEMTAVAIDLIGREITVTGAGYSPDGRFLQAAREIKPAADPTLRNLLMCAALCNDAALSWTRDGGRGHWEVVGDPTEGALLALARKGGGDLLRLASKHARVAEIPFEPERRMMAVACDGPDGIFTFVKGAPQVVLDLCDSRMSSGGADAAAVGRIPRERRFDATVAAGAAAMASRSMRVLALAYAPGNLISEGQGGAPAVGARLVFLGLVGMMDPPRPEAARSVALARQAGIRTVMITGDHAATAEAVAREIGLSTGAASDGGLRLVLCGEELDQMSDRDLEQIVDGIGVFARVAPAHKLRIVRALKARGHVVAMTGDGVNDAPAIREADIGIAMGRTGTDVAREASAMVLSDDNYATIIAAVEEGRSIYDNIRKFIRYLLASNVGEVLTMFIAAVGGLPMPLTPIQLLWMNLLTDGLPAMALAADPTDPDTMSRPPRRPDEGVFAGGLGLRIMVQGTFIGICTICCYLLAGMWLGHDLETARTMAFSTLVMSQLIYVFHCRSERRALSEIGLGTNRFLLAAAAISVVLQAAGIHTGAGRAFLGTCQLTVIDWVLVLFLSGWSSVLTAAARSVYRALRRANALSRQSESRETGEKCSQPAGASRNSRTQVE
ncbi:MAG: cation-translocating P-type ATPase [Clostridia bacterium]|nr:cation-translocating P-type ATPase [Clostridia bacterium]